MRFGDYLLTGRLGSGGMCHVFRAYRAEDDLTCAVKLLRDDARKDPKKLDAFVTEADVALLLDHPNLVRTVDAGEHDGRYYIAMELIEGADLRRLVRQCGRIGVALPPDYALYFINQLLRGLGALHAATGRTGRTLELVHRDLTPSNVLVSFRGRVIVSDFGVTQIMAYGTPVAGEAAGKLGYLSPEMVRGEPVDRRSDLFAAGVILWELLAGQRLFDGDDEQALLARIGHDTAPRLRKMHGWIPKGLDAVIAKTLSKKPKDRFSSAPELRAALRPYWSEKIGHPAAVSALLAALFRDEVARWRQRDYKRHRTFTVERDALTHIL